MMTRSSASLLVAALLPLVASGINCNICGPSTFNSIGNETARVAIRLQYATVERSCGQWQRSNLITDEWCQKNALDSMLEPCECKLPNGTRLMDLNQPPPPPPPPPSNQTSNSGVTATVPNENNSGGGLRGSADDEETSLKDDLEQDFENALNGEFSREAIIVLVVLALVLAVMFCCCVEFCCLRRYRRHQEEKKDQPEAEPEPEMLTPQVSINDY